MGCRRRRCMGRCWRAGRRSGPGMWRGCGDVVLLAEAFLPMSAGRLLVEARAGAREEANGMLYGLVGFDAMRRGGCWCRRGPGSRMPAACAALRALVTGGASPLGAAICRRLAADGFRGGGACACRAGAGSRRWRRSSGGAAWSPATWRISSGGGGGDAGTAGWRRAPGGGAQCRERMTT